MGFKADVVTEEYQVKEYRFGKLLLFSTPIIDLQVVAFSFLLGFIIGVYFC